MADGKAQGLSICHLSFGRPSDIAGDYTTEKRHAWDGATWFEIETEPAEMPEPPLGLLGLLGAAGTWARYGRWRRR